jgi:peptidoglycan-N-acetylglucosamine deacetylase
MRWFLIALLAVLCAPAQAEKRIALTFDDVPRAPGAYYSPDERTRRLITGLRRAGVRQAAFFLNPGRLAQPQGAGGSERIASYVAAGHVIANHSDTHPALSTSTVEDYLANIDAAEVWLRDRPGRRPWFRFPYLNEGRRDKAKRDAVRAGLAARHLLNGYVTVDGYDWKFDAMFSEAVRAGKVIDRNALKRLFIETHVGAANHFDALAIRMIGRSPAHVMLLHETDLSALYIPDLVRALRRDGWTIITADEAYADPISAEAATVDVPSAQGTLIEALAWQARLPMPHWYERNDEDILQRLFAQQVLKEGDQ